MKNLVVALVLSLSGAAYACDCQKKQEPKQAQCDCPGQSCPGACPGMDGAKNDKPKTDKPKKS